MCMCPSGGPGGKCHCHQTCRTPTHDWSETTYPTSNTTNNTRIGRHENNIARDNQQHPDRPPPPPPRLPERVLERCCGTTRSTPSPHLNPVFRFLLEPAGARCACLATPANKRREHDDITAVTTPEDLQGREESPSSDNIKKNAPYQLRTRRDNNMAYTRQTLLY